MVTSNVTLRVMSWNILNGGGGDAGRVALHDEVIRSVDPDVLLIQEARGFLDEVGSLGVGVWLHMA